MGGTNAHVILEEFPLSNEEIPGRRGGSLDPPLKSRDYQLIVLSAKTPSALDKMTENLAEYFKKNLLNPGNHANPANPGPDAAYTLQVGRKVFEHRRMLVCSHTREAIELLSSREPEGSFIFQQRNTAASDIYVCRSRFPVYRYGIPPLPG